MPQGPVFVRYFGPILTALRELGGSARPAEVRDRVALLTHATEAELAETTSSGQPRFGNKVAWARFYLARAGLIDASKRGVWALTERGLNTSLTHDQAYELFLETHQSFQATQVTDDGDDSSAERPAPEGVTTDRPGDYRAAAHEMLMRMSPAGFERFAQRLLREAGFQDVAITGRSGDGGIDGNGILQVNPLVSFKVLFQCKRYQGSVSPAQVRDFRGAMQGRADKGIIITTGTFTMDAKKEAIRDGVPPIELVDGERLIDMLEELELGLQPTRSFEVDEKFFTSFD